MTVIELRKLARENSVKLSAGIDKEGIINRLAESLGTVSATDTAVKGTAGEAHNTMQPMADAPVAAQEAREESLHGKRRVVTARG